MKGTGGWSPAPADLIRQQRTPSLRVRPCRTPKLRSVRSSTRWPPTMPDLQEMFRRLHDMVAEHRLAAQAVGRLRSAVQNGQVGLPSPTDQGDLVRTAGNLEPTYLVRLWAEFETALRSYRRYYTGNPDDQIRAIDLINWTAALKQGRTVSLAS